MARRQIGKEVLVFGDPVSKRSRTLDGLAKMLDGLPSTPLSARFPARNATIHRVRTRIKKVFGTWKRSYGLRRMRWRGLAKCRLQVYLAATAYNLRRTLTIHATA